MKGMLLWFAYIAAGFALGGVLFSRWLPLRLLGKDVRLLGEDGNPGAANVFLHCGVPMGLVCLCLDLLKGLLPVYLALRRLDTASLLFAAVIAAPVLGHAVAPFERGPGGKGIACAFGVLLGLLPATGIVFLLAALYILFSTVVRIDPTRRRSLLVFGLFGGSAAVWLTVWGLPSFALGCLAVSLIVFRQHLRDHRPAPPPERQAEAPAPETAGKGL